MTTDERLIREHLAAAFARGYNSGSSGIILNYAAQIETASQDRSVAALQQRSEGTTHAIPRLSWEYIGEELAIFWDSPYGRGKEKIASFWWPAHPVEATADVERTFEAIAARMAEGTTPAPATRNDVGEIRARLVKRQKPPIAECASCYQKQEMPAHLDGVKARWIMDQSWCCTVCGQQLFFTFTTGGNGPSQDDDIRTLLDLIADHPEVIAGDATMERETIQLAVSHWIGQGGEAQFGALKNNPQNPDELIAEILSVVRDAYSPGAVPEARPQETTKNEDDLTRRDIGAPSQERSAASKKGR